MAEKDYAGAGDKAAAAGLDVVEPSTDPYYYGGDEINITRDMIADISQVGTSLPAKGGPNQIFFRIGNY